MVEIEVPDADIIQRMDGRRVHLASGRTYHITYNPPKAPGEDENVVVYKPLRFFVAAGAIVFGGGLVIGLRFLYYFFVGAGEGKVQSLILAAVLLLMGFLLGIAGLLSDLIATNRRILEELQVEARSRQFDRD